MTLFGKRLKLSFFIWALAAGALVLDIGFYMLALKSKERKLASLENEYQVKRAAEAELASEAPGSADEEAKRGYRGIPRWEDFTKVMGEVYNKAGRLDLLVESASYQASSIKDSGIVKVTVAMPITGTYDKIKRFIYELETSPRSFIIESLSLGSGRGEEGEVSLKLTIVVHFRG